MTWAQIICLAHAMLWAGAIGAVTYKEDDPGVVLYVLMVLMAICLFGAFW